MSPLNKTQAEQVNKYTYLETDDTNLMETPKKVSAREKKLKQISNKFGEASSQAANGFMMGALVGGSMGAIIGIWTVIKTRKLIVLPISIITSGSFFGFIMMCGSIIRSDDENIYLESIAKSITPIGQQIQSLSNPVEQTPFWKLKYANLV